jgi:hypothetical protein
MFEKLKLWATALKRWIKGQQDGSDAGSTIRRSWARQLLVLTIFLFAFSFTNNTNTILSGIAGYLLSLYGLVFFIICVLLMPLRESASFSVGTQRLLKDTLISSSFLIVSVSYIYQFHGIKPAHDTNFDFLYFSAVTFSTLGYGDFAPEQVARPIAALQAVVGNLHLGMLVGAIFASLKRDEPKDHRQ